MRYGFSYSFRDILEKSIASLTIFDHKISSKIIFMKKYLNETLTKMRINIYFNLCLFLKIKKRFLKIYFIFMVLKKDF